MSTTPVGDAIARPWQRATLWLIFLGPFFLVTYSFANWLASQRAGVSTVVFTWENHIPYLPWSIVPYWSIDLFYAVSLFVCATRHELDTHATRLLAAQVIAVACFVLFPLRQSFVRPETDGIYGGMLDALLLFDKPFNQAPALHIALLIVLWVLYARHLHGLWRWLLRLWFTLIGVSVLTTFQHHFVDVPTGFLLGWVCVWLFPGDQPSLIARATVTKNPRQRALAARYFLGALATAAVAFGSGGWGLWLLWISTSLTLVATIYLWLDAAAFGKRGDGSMTPASLWLLAPYLLGAAINARCWTRHAPAASRVTPAVWIGRVPLCRDDIPDGVRTIVDLCAELPCVAPPHYVPAATLDLIPLTTAQLENVAQKITGACAHGPVLVCCALGYSRSAAAVAAWLITSGHATGARDAVARIRQTRQQVVLSDEQCKALDSVALTHQRC